MPKGYMISAHRRLADPEKATAYRALAIPALEAAGGKFWPPAAGLSPKRTVSPSGPF